VLPRPDLELALPKVEPFPVVLARQVLLEIAVEDDEEVARSRIFDWSAARIGTSSTTICRSPTARWWKDAKAPALRSARSSPRFLPYTTRSSLPQAPWLVRLHLAVRPAWYLLGGQTWLVAEKPAT
jgi:hypothetical protein